MKILIVEDEAKTGGYLQQGLTEAGYVVDLLQDGVDGLHAALENQYDLLILDIMLPGIDGWQVLQRLRKAEHDEPVLVLTAKDALEDRVKGLELGADDYLVKPFAFAELLARVKSLLRRGKQLQPDSLSLADLTLDVQRRRVTRDGKRIYLSGKEFGESQKTYGWLKKAFQNGQLDLPTYLKTENEKFDAELALNRARLEKSRAIARYNQAIGVLP